MCNKILISNDKKKTNKNITGAVVVVAGMSSRMKRFKPLLPLGEKTIIEHVIDSLRESGVQKIVVVTGNQTKLIVNQLENRDVHFVYNELYTTTTMFDSVKLGVTYIKNQCDMFFFLPGDIPLFRSHTLLEMKRTMEKSSCHIVQPTYKGKHGHPVLFSASCIDTILNHNGKMGLKGAIESIDNRLDLLVPDKGILLDADTPKDYEELLDYYKKRDIPDEEMCIEILKFFNTDERVIKHCQAVLGVSKKLTDRLKCTGYRLNEKLICSSALLHDVARKMKNHAKVGGEWLKEMGYDEVAEVIECHMDIEIGSIDALDEKAILYLADKLVIEDKEVSLEERFENTYKKFADQEIPSKAIEIRFNIAKRILDNICQREELFCENCASK
ncbi:DVU_1551 family NTP transferase [Alkalibaculum bacchi]|uniref:DVU_1551 family NTP transferase n=1 Tax=Alkalibaculum bacchi TaxID=645887 RepID=UPI0026F1E2A9|nr:NTP transferase domain-containing protein [Alkalibaculum bacchi]